MGEVVPADKLRPLRASDLFVGATVASIGLAYFGCPFVDIPRGLKIVIQRLEKQEDNPDPRVIFRVSVGGDGFELSAPYPTSQLLGIDP